MIKRLKWNVRYMVTAWKRRDSLKYFMPEMEDLVAVDKHGNKIWPGDAIYKDDEGDICKIVFSERGKLPIGIALEDSTPIPGDPLARHSVVMKVGGVETFKGDEDG